jgi:hypothetical protein
MRITYDDIAWKERSKLQVKTNTKVKRIAWMRSVECPISEIQSHKVRCTTLLVVDISVAVIGIQRHIHRMGIALHLGGSMSSMPHVRPPLDAFILVSGQIHNEDGATNLRISQSHGMPLQSL